jgi:glycosyltransferase involved in cell wall biosynthesis
MTELAVVIPAYNEERSLAATVTKVRHVLAEAGIDYELIVVDDGSKDRTAEIAKELDVHLVSHTRNRGYGTALKSGIRVATATYIGIIDADGTYPIERLPDLYREAVTTGSEHVIGARKGEQVHDTPGRWIARRVLRLIAFIATGRWIDDLNSGMRVFTRSVALQSWSLFPAGFSFTSTITIATLQSDVDVRFVPIDYFAREGKSHIKPVRDFFRFFSLIVRISFLYSPLRFFVVPGTVLFLTGIGLLIGQIVGDRNVADSAVLVTLFGGQLLLNGLVAESLARLHLRPLAV